MTHNQLNHTSSTPQIGTPRNTQHRSAWPVAAALLMAATLSAADSINSTTTQPTGWPNWRGAGCNGTASESDISYIDSLNDAKLLWTSEALVLGTYVGSCTGNSGRLSSGVSSPIAADGKVFLYYYKAAKDPVVLANESFNENRYKSYPEYLRSQYNADAFYKSLHSEEDHLRLRSNIYAEDHIICMDLNTGKTLWDTVLPGMTFNTTRSNSKLEPAYADGMLAAANEAGRLCGIDANTGTIVWTWTNETVAKQVAERLENSATKKRLIPRFASVANLMIADGVVLYQGCDKNAVLQGFDLKTGKRLWDMIDTGTFEGRTAQALTSNKPLRWSTAGKEYGIAKGTCFEPRTGKIRWHLTNVGIDRSTPALSENHIVYGSSGSKGFTCYHITADQAKLAWSLPAARGQASLKSGSGSPCIVGEHVYGIGKRYRTGGRQIGLLLCIELATGKIIAEQTIGIARGSGDNPGQDGCTSLFSFGNVICYRAANKTINGRLVTWDLKPKPLTTRTIFQPASCNVAASPTVAEGKLLLRGTGHILCYDLRKQP